MPASDIKDWLETLNYITVIGGVIWAAIQWPKAQAQRIAAESASSYAALNDQFLKFLELQLLAPGLGSSSTDRNRIWENLDSTQRDQQRTLFDFLASILERAFYFLHASDADPAKWDKEQWPSWDHWIRSYANNPNFIAFWRDIEESGDSASYGAEFVSYIKRVIEKQLIEPNKSLQGDAEKQRA